MESGAGSSATQLVRRTMLQVVSKARVTLAQCNNVTVGFSHWGMDMAYQWKEIC